MAAWVGHAAAEVAPVARRLWEAVLSSARVFADETVVPVLDPGRGRAKRGYFWALARDDRAWGGEHARALLGGYRGVVQRGARADARTVGLGAE